MLYLHQLHAPLSSVFQAQFSLVMPYHDCDLLLAILSKVFPTLQSHLRTLMSRKADFIVTTCDCRCTVIVSNSLIDL